MDWQYLVLYILCFSQSCFADNGMNMAMDGSMSLAVGNMLAYLHFTPGDNCGLYFLRYMCSANGVVQCGSLVGFLRVQGPWSAHVSHCFCWRWSSAG